MTYKRPHKSFRKGEVKESGLKKQNLPKSKRMCSQSFQTYCPPITYLPLHVHNDNCVWSVANNKVFRILRQQNHTVDGDVCPRCAAEWFESVTTLRSLHIPNLENRTKENRSVQSRNIYKPRSRVLSHLSSMPRNGIPVLQSDSNASRYGEHHIPSKHRHINVLYILESCLFAMYVDTS